MNIDVATDRIVGRVEVSIEAAINRIVRVGVSSRVVIP